MRLMLNRFIPFDEVVRWWYILVAGPAVGLIFSLVTGLKPFAPLAKVVHVEGPLGETKSTVVWIAAESWKDDLLFTVLGFLLASALVWLLEEIRLNNQPRS